MKAWQKNERFPKIDEYVEIFEARGHKYNEATSLSPGAREAERTELLGRLGCQPGQVIGDIPAGGGFVADGLHTCMGDSVHIICIEPSEKFVAPIMGRYVTLINPIDAVDLPADSLDGIASLAGLHHLENKKPVYAEWARLLRARGRLSVGDVSTDTATGEFLNGFVDKHTPLGHAGIFIAAGTLTGQLESAGFDVLDETLEDVPWRFTDREMLGRFCKSLFGIETATTEEVACALESIVGTDTDADGSILLRWQLRYATAIRN